MPTLKEIIEKELDHKLSLSQKMKREEILGLITRDLAHPEMRSNYLPQEVVRLAEGFTDGNAVIELEVPSHMDRKSILNLIQRDIEIVSKNER